MNSLRLKPNDPHTDSSTAARGGSGPVSESDGRLLTLSVVRKKSRSGPTG
ncbi:hypothetical protein [Labedaea rhizosphaerae]|nr:hypothetical protein [Labedaea rhizosphaerae]